MGGHRLRREIVATVLTNEMVNWAGTSFDFRMTDETGAGVADITRAHVVAVRRPRACRAGGTASTTSIRPSRRDVQFELFLDLRRMVERGVLWLLRHRRPPLDLGVDGRRVRSRHRGAGRRAAGRGPRRDGRHAGRGGRGRARTPVSRRTWPRPAAVWPMHAHRMGHRRGGAGPGSQPARRRRRLLGPLRRARRRLAVGAGRQAAPLRPLAEPCPGRAARRPDDDAARPDRRRAAQPATSSPAVPRPRGRVAGRQRADRPAGARRLHGDPHRQRRSTSPRCRSRCGSCATSCWWRLAGH